MCRVAYNMIPPYLCEEVQRRSDSKVNASLRSDSYENFVIPKPKLSLFNESLSYSGPVIWNSIPHEINNFTSLNSFAENVIQQKTIGWDCWTVQGELNCLVAAT